MFFPSLQLVKDEQCLQPDSIKEIFIKKVVWLDQQTLTIYDGYCCFKSFYHRVYSSNDTLYEGIGQLWQVICTGKEDTAQKALYYMQKICTDYSPLEQQERKVGDQVR